MEKIIIDSIDTYNNIVGLPTYHPLVAVVDLKEKELNAPSVTVGLLFHTDIAYGTDLLTNFLIIPFSAMPTTRPYICRKMSIPFLGTV